MHDAIEIDRAREDEKSGDLARLAEDDDATRETRRRERLRWKRRLSRKR